MEKNCKLLSVPQLQDDDGISKLPDEILVDILSTLKFKEALQTSVLSHRWLNLWKHVPLLHFDATNDLCQSHCYKQWRKYMPVFVNWVNHVLHSRRHNISILREFRIFFHLDNCYQNEIDKWLEYAFQRGVQRLELNFSQCGFFQLVDKDSYSFPNQLLDQTTELGVQLAAKSSFSCLKALYLVAVNVTGDTIESLLLKCPLLEDLRVIASKTLINLVVSGPSLLLKHLEITGCYDAELITISNTNIASLKVSPKGEGLSLINLPMLTEVWINGRWTRKPKLFSLLSYCFSQLTVFTLEIDVPEMYVDLYEFPQLQNLRRLVLVSIFTHFQSLIRLTSLIDLCPNLVEFALMFYPVRGTGRIVENDTAKGQSLNGLKVLELHGYHGGKNQNELIMFLIERAIALEKIVIDPRVVNTGHGAEPIEDKRAEKARRLAIENFEGVVPQHIELAIF